jgi:hypothetical protein
MSKRVVNTFQELRAVQKQGFFPSLVIGGELANSLLVSGLVCVSSDGSTHHGFVASSSLPPERGPIHEVFDLLRELSYSNRFEVVQASTGPEILVFQQQGFRKEGN